MPPAARITDPVVHPLPPVLSPGPGSPNVLIGFLPAWRAVPAATASALQSAKQTSDAKIKAAEAATAAAPDATSKAAAKAAEETLKAAEAAAMGAMITSMAGMSDIHTCATPLPVPPHGPGVVIDCSPTVLINNLKASRQGDTILEAIGPNNKIAMGCTTVIIGDSGSAGESSSANPSIPYSPGTPGGEPGSETTTDPTSPTETTTPAEDPNVPPPTEQARTVEPDITCAIEKVDAVCSHGRKMFNGYLGVVIDAMVGTDIGVGAVGTTNSTAEGVDVVTFTATVQMVCPRHVEWEIQDQEAGGTKTRKGVVLEHDAQNPDLERQDVPSFLGVRWLSDIKPRRYLIRPEACDTGSLGPFTVDAYPGDESGITISFEREAGEGLKKAADYQKRGIEYLANKIRDGIEKVISTCAKFIPNLKDVEVTLLEGSITLKNGWKELPSPSNRCEWSATGEIKFDPLVEADAKIAITPSLPSWITKYVPIDIFAYVGLTGTIAGGARFQWQRSYCEGGGEGSGALALSLGAKAESVLYKDTDDEYTVVSLDGKGTTALEVPF